MSGIDPKLREMLERDIRRVLREHGCSDQAIDDVAEEFIAELARDEEVSEWLLRHIHREMN